MRRITRLVLALVASIVLAHAAVGTASAGSPDMTHNQFPGMTHN
jgi:hypothetical protein